MNYDHGIAQYYGALARYQSPVAAYRAPVSGFGAPVPGFGTLLVQDPSKPRGQKHFVIGTEEEAQRWGCPIGTPILECPGWLENPDAPPVQVQPPQIMIPMVRAQPRPPMALTAFEAPRQAEKKRPAWQTPVMVGGGILALTGLGYILFKARRRR
jgi:hypothetical protein